MKTRKFLLIFPAVLFFGLLGLGSMTSADAKVPAVCDVKVVKTLQAFSMRGMAHLEDVLTTTKDSGEIQRYAHSGYHVSCRFQVEVNGKTYLYYDESNIDESADPQKECRAKYDAIREKIISVTQSCKNLEAPDRYGTTLHPFFP